MPHALQSVLVGETGQQNERYDGGGRIVLMGMENDQRAEGKKEREKRKAISRGPSIILYYIVPVSERGYARS